MANRYWVGAGYAAIYSHLRPIKGNFGMKIM